jgi:hypothetical protein
VYWDQDKSFNEKTEVKKKSHWDVLFKGLFFKIDYSTEQGSCDSLVHQVVPTKLTFHASFRSQNMQGQCKRGL